MEASEVHRFTKEQSLAVNLWRYKNHQKKVWRYCTFSRHQRCTISQRSKGGPSNDEHDLKYKKNKNISALEDTRYAVEWQNKVRQCASAFSSLQYDDILPFEGIRGAPFHHFTKEQSWAVKWWTWFKIYENIVMSTWKNAKNKKVPRRVTNRRPEMQTVCSCSFLPFYANSWSKGVLCWSIGFCASFWRFHANLRQLFICSSQQVGFCSSLRFFLVCKGTRWAFSW